MFKSDADKFDQERCHPKDIINSIINTECIAHTFENEHGKEHASTSRTLRAKELVELDLISCSYPASILRKSTSGRHRPVSYPDGPMTARYRFT